LNKYKGVDGMKSQSVIKQFVTKTCNHQLRIIIDYIILL